MEVDAMHAATDSAQKNVKINAPSEWPIVLQLARRRPGPYVVREIEQREIFDLHRLSKLIGTNSMKNVK